MARRPIWSALPSSRRRRSSRVTEASSLVSSSPSSSAYASARPKSAVTPSSLRRARVTLLKSNAVHPVATTAEENDAAPSSFVSQIDVDIAVLHALDLYNPCAIRSCAHAFCPVVTLHIDDHAVLTVEAARHGANHTAFPRLRLRHRLLRPAATLRATVFSRCTTPLTPGLIRIGELDSLELTTQPERMEIARFFPVLRDTRTQRFALGKLKLVVQYHEPREEAAVTPSLPRRPPAFDFASALQRQRQQLRPTAPVAQSESLDALESEAEARAKTAAEAEAEARVCRQQLEELTNTLAASGLLVASERLELLHRIGDGVHATVFRARQRQRSQAGDECLVDVAVKQFRYQPRGIDERLPPSRVLAAFRRELETLQRLQNVSESLVRLHGAVLTPTLAIVTELCDDGRHVLRVCLSDVCCLREH
ncbi:hypothetical protein PINS_up005004 [Pythium insidiosum]|nr:hypothetical protein PINS_up005004 [Pythium insidiosum]